MVAFGKGRGGLENQIICLKYVIFFFNVMSWIVGAAIFGLATWIRFQDDFKEWIIELGMQHYWRGIWVLFVAGILVMTISFIGCCGAVAENRHLLSFYAACLFICFVLQLGGAAYTLDNGIERSKLQPWLEDRFFYYITRYEIDTRHRRIVDMIQEFIGCCGAFGAGDYDKLGLMTPDTCRNHVTGNEYVDGCREVFAWYMETKTGWIAGVALSLCFLQIFGFAFTICLCRALQRESRLRKERGY